MSVKITHKNLMSICDAYKIATLIYLYKEKNLRYYRRYYHLNIQCDIKLIQGIHIGYYLKIQSPDKLELVTCKREALVSTFENEKFFYALLSHFKNRYTDFKIETFKIEKVSYFKPCSDIEELTLEEIKDYPQLVESFTEMELNLIEEGYFDEFLL